MLRVRNAAFLRHPLSHSPPHKWILKILSCNLIKLLSGIVIVLFSPLLNISLGLSKMHRGEHTKKREGRRGEGGREREGVRDLGIMGHWYSNRELHHLFGLTSPTIGETKEKEKFDKNTFFLKILYKLLILTCRFFKFFSVCSICCKIILVNFFLLSCLNNQNIS